MMKAFKNAKVTRSFALALATLVLFSGMFASSHKISAASAATPDTSVSNTASLSTDVIYQIVTDRFLDGNPSNNPTGAIYDKSNPAKYHGGDWAGITQEINNNYFTDLGITALWISPPVQNIDVMDPSNNTASYAGYWAKDYFQPNPYFGTTTDFRNLVNAAHAKGIKVIIDFAPNHTSTADDGSMTFPYDGGLYQNGKLLASLHNDPSGMFNHEQWTDFSTLENCIYHSLYGLADLNQQNSTVDSYLKSAINTWLDMGVDGIRVDAVKHMAQGWQTNWLSSIYTHKPVFVFGEWFNGGTSADPQMQNFANTSGMNVLEYRFANAVRNVFSGTNTMYDLDSVISATSADYNDVNDQVTFIDNHDLSRFDTVTNDNHNEDGEAYVLLLTSRGIPTVYYGSEQYSQGASDPNNRADMPSFSETSNAYQVISKLAPLHKSNPALAYGTSTQRWVNNDVYIYERKFGNNVVLTAINRNQNTGYSITGLNTALPAGTYSDVLTGLLGGGNITVSSGGAVTSFTLKAGEAAVWQYTSNSYAAPTIGNIDPMMDAPGNTITIDGRDFGTSAGTVDFGTTAAPIVSWGDSEIKVQVPNVAAGTYDIKVVNSGGTSSNVYHNFNVLSGQQVSVRFMVNNATTSMGQNVYLSGSVNEIGNWDTSKAIGPMFNGTASIANYPTWFYDVSVPAGTTISYKFIKKDAAGNVIWEGGSNHTFTTPASGTATVTVNWQN